MANSSETIIIGGGVIGLSVAWRLRQAGVKVTLFEHGVCGRQASWSAVGVLSPGNPNYKHAMARMHLDSLDMYPHFCAELHDATGIDPQYERCRRLEFCDDDQRYRMGLSEVRAASDRTMPDGSPVLEMLTPEQAVEVEPAIRRPKYGALSCRISAQVRSPRLLQTLKKACLSTGVAIREQAHVAGLVRDGDRVTGVRLADGAARADTVILAAGAWSSRIDAPAAELVPVWAVRGQALLLEMDDRPFSRIVRRKGCYVLSRRDGKILVGSTVEHDAGFEIRNTAKGVQSMIDGALDLLPVLAEAKVIGMWSGLRPCTPDWRPYIGPVPGTDGLIAACGHFKTGLVFAPITARIVADLVTAGSTPFDLARATPGRPIKQPRRKRP